MVANTPLTARRQGQWSSFSWSFSKACSLLLFALVPQQNWAALLRSKMHPELVEPLVSAAACEQVGLRWATSGEEAAQAAQKDGQHAAASASETPTSFFSLTGVQHAVRLSWRGCFIVYGGDDGCCTCSIADELPRPVEMELLI